jgi:hypothetical protein
MIGEGHSVLDITDTIGDDGYDRDELQQLAQEFRDELDDSNEKYTKKQDLKEDLREMFNQVLQEMNIMEFNAAY